MESNTSLRQYNVKQYAGALDKRPDTLPFGDFYFAEDVGILFKYNYNEQPIAIGGVSTSFLKVDNYSSLPAIAAEDDVAYVINKQGTPWLPGSVGGSYRAPGWYAYINGEWVSDSRFISNQFNTNESLIAANTTKVSYTDAAAVALNTAKISYTDAAAVSLNTAKVSFDLASSTRLAGTSGTNTGDQDISGIGINAANIGNNATNITANAGFISTNGANIGNNATNISANAGFIATNGTNIGNNATNISNNAGFIATNGSNIAAHATAIGLNTAKISYTDAAQVAQNTSDISDLQGGGSDPVDPVYGLLSARYETTIATNVNATTDTLIAFDVEAFADDGFTNTSSTLKTITTGARYRINATVAMFGSQGNYRYTSQISIRKNGSTIIGSNHGAYIRAATGSNESYIMIDGMYELADGDTIEILVKRVSTTSGNASVVQAMTHLELTKMN